MTTGLRAITVAVDYTDLLAITLPYNAHHFDEVYVVTDVASRDGVSAVVMGLEAEAVRTGRPRCARVLTTELFTANGAAFNKWAALEWGLDRIGRYGWLCLLDADVLWPRDVLVEAACKTDDPSKRWLNMVRGYEHDCVGIQVSPGQLLTPYRRMFPLKAPFGPADVPPEERWADYPVHRNVREWAGYSQIFHASDPALPAPPWHDVNLTNAGAADSWFQARWDYNHKVRPPWEVLHLGEAGANWFGRATPRLDGSVPDGAAARREAVAALWRTRRARKLAGQDPFGAERLPPAGGPGG